MTHEKILAMLAIGVACALPGSTQLMAQDLLKDADPCTKAKSEFRSEKGRIHAAYENRKVELKGLEMPREEYRLAWTNLAREVARREIGQRYKKAGLSAEQLDQMSAVEAENYIEMTGEEGIEKELQTLFEEHRAQALEDLEQERKKTDGEIEDQEQDLDDACGNGTFEVLVRSFLASVDRRIKAMESETSLDGKVVKFLTDISLDDIQKHGLLGGENSEARKIVEGIGNVVTANLEAAQREKGDLDQAIRATTGVSVEDIKRNGVLGGKNSDARKLCKALFGKC